MKGQVKCLLSLCHNKIVKIHYYNFVIPNTIINKKKITKRERERENSILKQSCK